MSKIIDQRSSLDKTVKIFDSFYAFELVVNGDEFDIVHGYFRSIMTANIAGNLTTMMFRISQETGIPVLDLLGFIKGKTKLEMNQVITYYLNSFKSKTTLYGTGMVPQPNQPVARNIVQ